MIPQDRSTTAIELERVLDDLLPLLRTIQPAKLNATLNALATALEGRGERLGENLELVDGYFTELNPELPDDQEGHLRAGRRVADLRRRGPRPGADAAQLLAVDHEHDQGQVGRPTPASSPAPPGSRRRPGELLRGERATGSSSWPPSAGRPSSCWRGTRPEYPCLLQGLAQSNDFIGKTFANGELHITLEVTQARKGYVPGEEPGWGEHRGPDCYGAAEPAAAVAGQPLPATAPHGAGSASSVVPGFLLSTRRAVTAGPPRSSGSSTPWWRRRWACRPTRCPTSPPCCSGRWRAGRRWGSREDHVPR